MSRSGYYAWRRRLNSARALATRQLLVRMQQLHRQMKAPYGVVKLWRALRLIGARCSRHRVARLRRQYSLIAHGGSGRVFWIKDRKTRGAFASTASSEAVYYSAFFPQN